VRYNKEELEDLFRSAEELFRVLVEYARERFAFDTSFPRYVDSVCVDEDSVSIRDDEYGQSTPVTVDDLLSLDDLRAEFEEHRRREVQEKLDRARLKAAFDAEEEKRTLRALLAKYPEEARIGL
jgi:hypothetical protein